MLFNSFAFPVFFLLFFLGYFLLDRKLRQIWILLASCYFYMAVYPPYLLILFFLICLDYGVGLLLPQSKQRRLLLVSSLVANFSLLFVFKYFDFLVGEWNQLGFPVLPQLKWVLPIGLSFHTFQSVSYVIEVYRGNYPPEKDLLRYALYVLFWPQLVAGPIERPQHLLNQLKANPFPNSELISQGGRLILWGLIKKIVIADRLAWYVDLVFSHPQDFAGIPLWLGMYFFTFQIYCDFSGYTDIARGCANLMGYQLQLNFDRPYLALSLREFWKRWHISLSSWFRDYLYIPLGGNYLHGLSWGLAVLFVFSISGMWHGANWTYLAWGLFHGAGLILERQFQRHKLAFPVSVKWLLTFHWVAFGWIFFRATSIQDALNLFSRLFQASQPHPITSNFGITSQLIGGDIALIASLLLLESLLPKLNRTVVKMPQGARWAIYYGGIALLFFFGIMEQRQFIYFQF